MMTEGSGASKGLFWFAVLLASLTVVLLLAGALVTSNEAGDAVPDWPLSFGRWLIGSDQFVANVRYEYSHRVIAGATAIATWIFAIAAWLSPSASRLLKRLALIALAGIIFQALVGGFRVLFPSLKPIIAVLHAIVAQSFFGLVVAMCVLAWPGWGARDQIKLSRSGAAAIAAIIAQAALGAAFRHGTFGRSAWAILPHALGAFIVTALICRMAIAAIGSGWERRRPAKVALALLVVQLILGLAAYLSRLTYGDHPQPVEPMITLTASHVVLGALLLSSAVVLAMRCRQPKPLEASFASSAK
jgi:cytochrome c oxidase assembly protein subunit 15